MDAVQTGGIPPALSSAAAVRGEIALATCNGASRLRRKLTANHGGRLPTSSTALLLGLVDREIVMNLIADDARPSFSSNAPEDATSAAVTRVTSHPRSFASLHVHKFNDARRRCERSQPRDDVTQKFGRRGGESAARLYVRLSVRPSAVETGSRETRGKLASTRAAEDNAAKFRLDSSRMLKEYEKFRNAALTCRISSALSVRPSIRLRARVCVCVAVCIAESIPGYAGWRVPNPILNDRFAH